MRELYLDSDNDVYLENLTDSDGDPVDDATVSVVLKDAAGSELAGSDVTLTLISGTTNDYKGVIPSTAVSSDDIAENAILTLHVEPSSSGRNVLIRPKFKAVFYEGEEEEDDEG